MSGGFRSRQDGKRPEVDDVLIDESGIRVTHEAVVTRRQEYAFDQIVEASRRITRPLWGPLILAILGTINLAAGFQTDAPRDFIAAGLMLGGGMLWWRFGLRHTLVLNVGGKAEDAWLTRDGELMDRVLEAVVARVRAVRGS